MPKPGSTSPRTIPSGTVLRGGTDLALSLADDAVADEAVADVEPSGKPQLAAGAASVRRSATGAASSRNNHTGTATQRSITPGVSSARG